jgi:CubicO group peptidase (beta-lactamase class C family)
MKQFAIISLLLFALISSNLFGQSYHQVLENIAVENQLTGMSVAVVCNGTVSDVYHYGKADIGRNLFVSDSTMYRIASISKAVTATSLMKLYDNGLFQLDDNVSDYLGFNLYNPNFPLEKITFRMLLNHTSGLVDGSGYNGLLSATGAQNPPPPISQLLQAGGNYYSSDMWLNQAPGTWFTYANINYGVIATLIEQISGLRFDIFTKENILLPLGISGSFNIQDIENINNVAVLYRNAIPQADHYQGITPPPRDLSQYIIGSNGLIFSPQGGLRISALELANFMMLHAANGMWNGENILSEPTVQLMHQIQWDYNGSNGNNYYDLFNRWGLGFHLTTNTANGDIVIPDVIMIGHPGEAYGLISDMYFEKEKQFGLIFITNGYYGQAGYEWGNYSAFYLPEEQVFHTVYEYKYNTCFPSGARESAQLAQTKVVFNNELNQLITGPALHGAYLEIYNLNGQIRYKTSINKQIMQLPVHNRGLYLLKIQTKEGVLVQKIVR